MILECGGLFLAAFGEDLLTSSISPIASSTLPGLMFELAFIRSTFRRLLMALFVAVCESSSNCVRWNKAS